MASLPRVALSPEEYVALEQSLGAKHEYHDGQMFAMSGVSDAHAILQVNAGLEVAMRLRDSKCIARSSDFRIVIEAAGMATYPDLSVVCGPVQPSPRFKHSCTNPTVLFEVLSPSTESYDRGAKFEQYRKLATLREYVLISQHEASVDLFRLQNGHWVLYEFRGETATLHLESLNIEIPMSELYRNVSFADAETSSLE